MDENTKEVLMAVIALISAIVTPIIVLYVNQKQIKKLDKVEGKVDEYHRSVNGNMEKLLKTREELATANEKVRAASETSASAELPGGPVKLNITEGQIRVVPEATKKKK